MHFSEAKRTVSPIFLPHSYLWNTNSMVFVFYKVARCKINKIIINPLTRRTANIETKWLDFVAKSEVKAIALLDLLIATIDCFKQLLCGVGECVMLSLFFILEKIIFDLKGFKL